MSICPYLQTNRLYSIIIPQTENHVRGGKATEILECVEPCLHDRDIYDVCRHGDVFGYV